MQDSVFYAAYILVDIEPILHTFFIQSHALPRFFIACKTSIIPRTFKKGIKRVALFLRAFATFRTKAVFPARVHLQGVALACDFYVIGQGYG